MKSQKKKPQFAARKKAFDEVMDAYRDAKDSNGGIGAVVVSDGGRGVSNPVRPSLTDFRCDVDRVISKCIPYGHKALGLRFWLAYVMFDSESIIENEVYAEKVMGSLRHNLEQGIGAEFIKRGIYPLHGKRGYFHVVRQSRPTDAI